MKPEEYKTITYEPGVITKFVHIEGAKRNPLTGAFILEFKDALSRFQRNKEAKVGVVLADGPVFCAGHNLGFVSQMQDWKPSKGNVLTEVEWREQMDFMRENFYFPVWDCKKPLIVGVQGGAYVGGAEFAMLCDIVVAAANTVFDMGILRITGAGSANTLAYFIGYHKAMEIYLTGWNFTAEEAEQWGAINKVVPDDQLEAEVMRYANIIALMPPATVRLLKESLKFAMNRMGFRDNIWYGCETNIMGHLVDRTREKEFYNIAKTQGLRAALDHRDKPFEKYGYSRFPHKKELL